MVTGTVDVPGWLYSAFFAPPFAIVAVIALRDLLFEVAMNNVEAPCRKRVIQVVAVSMVWLVTAVVSGPLVLAARVTSMRIAFLFAGFIWSPGVIAYAWATVPSTAEASRPINRSRVALLYDRFFGINGKVHRPQLRCPGLHSVTLVTSLIICSDASSLLPTDSTSCSRFRFRRCRQWYCRPGPSCRCWARSSACSTSQRRNLPQPAFVAFRHPKCTRLSPTIIH